MGAGEWARIANGVGGCDDEGAMRLSDLMHEDGYPRAPTQEQWDRLSSEERQTVVDVLPGEVTDAEQAMPEGDRHFRPKVQALDALRGHFNRLRRQVYVASELPIYYPGARRFAPDLLVVFDVEDHARDKFVVSHEGKGLDWVMEVHVGGDRKKDAVLNVERYASLGIPEYFIFDGGRHELLGFRLSEDGGRYVPIPSKGGRLSSRSLGLDLHVEDGRLRFLHGNGLVLESSELIQRLETQMEELRTRAEAEQAMVESTRLRNQELERRLAEAQKELEQLRRR